ncbi:MAG: heavy-metal-associated domain-containing protein [Desulfatitalea sp.]|nr:heavy-metal-associated domain-containing protein [Desulfatitalea sp.]
MSTQKFHIPKISCGHCTRTIENELKELAGIQKVESDILAKTVTVDFQAPASEDQIRATLKEINYPAA